MSYSGVAIFGTQSYRIYLQPKAIAERARDDGVEERKGFSPPNGHTTSASSTRLPLGSGI